MPKIPASKSEEYRQKLYDIHAKKKAKQERGMSWGTVLLTLLLFVVLAAVGLVQKQPVLLWAAIGLGNTIIFFQILYIVVKRAARRR